LFCINDLRRFIEVRIPWTTTGRLGTLLMTFGQRAQTMGNGARRYAARPTSTASGRHRTRRWSIITETPPTCTPAGPWALVARDEDPTLKHSATSAWPNARRAANWPCTSAGPGRTKLRSCPGSPPTSCDRPWSPDLPRGQCTTPPARLLPLCRDAFPQAPRPRRRPRLLRAESVNASHPATCSVSRMNA
jgi:hypothetical protein